MNGCPTGLSTYCVLRIGARLCDGTQIGKRPQYDAHGIEQVSDERLMALGIGEDLSTSRLIEKYAVRPAAQTRPGKSCCITISVRT